MTGFALYLGNKNYSSWSMRAWLAMKHTGAPFDEQVFHLGAPGIRDEIGRRSPSRRVPALHHGKLVIWDSLAIVEYLHEQFPDCGLWPPDADARAVARAVSAEMHSGFFALRAKMPFNVRRVSPGKGRDDDVLADIERILAIWADCRARFGGEGEFLFGEVSMADYMYAPVVSRFNTYAVEMDEFSKDYAAAVWDLPAVREWRRAAKAETAVEAEYDL